MMALDASLKDATGYRIPFMVISDGETHAVWTRGDRTMLSKVFKKMLRVPQLREIITEAMEGYDKR